MAEVQTRSETTGIRLFSSITDALEAAEADESIWKISFDAASGERVRLVRGLEGWVLSSYLRGSG